MSGDLAEVFRSRIIFTLFHTTMNTSNLYVYPLKGLRLFAKKGGYNEMLFCQGQEEGYDYLINPKNGEMHRCKGGKLEGSHNLVSADLDEFYWVVNLGIVSAHLLFDGTELPFYDIQTGNLLGKYVLKKCGHCFPDSL